MSGPRFPPARRIRQLAAFIVTVAMGLASTPLAAQRTREWKLVAPADQGQESASFQFSRTRYFSELLVAQGCSGLDPARGAADQKASNDFGGRLRAVFHGGFDPDVPIDPAAIQPGPCAVASIGSFKRKIAELGWWADRGADWQVGRLMTHLMPSVQAVSRSS